MSSYEVEVYNTYLDTTARATAKRTVWILGPEVPSEMTFIEITEAMEYKQTGPLERTP